MLNDLATWLEYLKNAHPLTMDFTLDRITAVAERLGVLHFACPVVMVTGTNGKGSTVAFLESMLCQYRVGSYTSPHLLRYTDQIRINRQECQEDQLVAAFKQIEEVRGTITLTLFEWTTLAALWILQHAKLDLVILEVGMGGRFDAVNIIDADIAVITTIGLDHTAWLGTTREEIGQHKAGIMRPFKPVIFGDVDVPNSIKEEATRLSAPLFCKGQNFNEHMINPHQWQWSFQNQCLRAELPMPILDVSAASTALMVYQLLEDKMAITQEALSHGIATAELPGRFQVETDQVVTIFDVAHNPQACLNLARKIRERYADHVIHAVVGMLKDKDIERSLDNMIPVVDCWYVANLPGERGAEADRLYKHLIAKAADAVQQHQTVTAAYQACQAIALPGSVILVFGSFLTVAEVMQNSA